jgi:hypothetical protein
VAQEHIPKELHHRQVCGQDHGSLVRLHHLSLPRRRHHQVKTFFLNWLLVSKMEQKDHPCGLYYKHIMIIDDVSHAAIWDLYNKYNYYHD